jgi:hypothetical protein
MTTATEAALAMAQTIGELTEGQRQINARLDRLESKVDKLVWLGVGIIGTTLATMVATLVTTLAG